MKPLAGMCAYAQAVLHIHAQYKHYINGVVSVRFYLSKGKNTVKTALGKLTALLPSINLYIAYSLYLILTTVFCLGTAGACFEREIPYTVLHVYRL